MSSSRSQGGAETTVVTAFYSLILLTSTLRTLWFLIPSTVWSPYYTPHATMAFDSTHTNPQWKMTFIEILLQGAGSLSLFSIFILILVYWADILKKYFYPGARRTKPMTTFFALVSILALIQLINAICFLLQEYSSEGMILVNSITLSIVSMVCVCEITIFSHRFRTVLKTLGDINQVSTESQVKRIVWITVTGNAFFFTRAFLETIFALLVGVYWHKNGNVAMVFSHKVWDGYILMKHWSELAILGLMLYILQSRFANGGDDSSQPHQVGGVGVGGGGMEPMPNAVGGGGGRNGNNLGYQAVPDADPGVDDDDDGAVDALRPTLSV
ncbi:hypothetical protein ACHAWU_007376 [Discostella pseudostelligera]|uniref:Uncharacterized protein n=1 Tax=Discostella pseudostelligera TaxID=259834 RepID=A0ABD3MCV3_9STRA